MSKGTIQGLFENSGRGVIVLRTEDLMEFSVPFNFADIKNYRGQSSREMNIHRGSEVNLVFDRESRSIKEIDLGLPPAKRRGTID